MVGRRIAEMMVVLVTSFAGGPAMATVDARQGVGVGSFSRPNFDVDPLARLESVALAWSVGLWPVLARCFERSVFHKKVTAQSVGPGRWVLGVTVLVVAIGLVVGVGVGATGVRASDGVAFRGA